MRSYWLKTIGQLFLLSAFIGEWFFLDHIREEQENMKRAVLEANSAIPIAMAHYQLFRMTGDVEELKRSVSADLQNELMMISVAEAITTITEFGEVSKQGPAV